MNVQVMVKLGLSNIIRRMVALLYYAIANHRKAHAGKVLILMYHRVLAEQDKTIKYIQPGMYVTTSSFTQQMEFVKKFYNVISLDTLLILLETNALDKSKAYCVVTFDDGWLDNYQNAFPILKKNNIPATVFLATKFIGVNRWFWHEKISHLIMQLKIEYVNAQLFIKDDSWDENNSAAVMIGILKRMNASNQLQIIDEIIETLKHYSESEREQAIDDLYKLFDEQAPVLRNMLDWDEVREMSKSNISFGAHTCNHKILTSIPLNEAQQEITESMLDIQKNNINFSPVFCYPNGNYNAEVLKLVKSAGYQAAVTTKFGYESEPVSDAFSMNRIGVHNDVSSSKSLFAFHLSGLRKRLPF